MTNFFVARQNSDAVSTSVLEKDSATVLEKGDLCTLDANGLAIKAVAASTQIALVVSPLSATQVLVTADPSIVLEGTADAVFAETMRNTEVDIAIDGSGNQLIDVGASTTDVLKILATEDAGTVGSTLKVRAKINKPLSL